MWAGHLGLQSSPLHSKDLNTKVAKSFKNNDFTPGDGDGAVELLSDLGDVMS